MRNPEKRFTLVRKTELGDNLGAREQASLLKTEALLRTWRSRFAGDGPLEKTYTVNETNTKISSATPPQVEADVDVAGSHTVYSFDGSTIERHDFAPSGDNIPPVGNPLDWHNELSRLLFECDEQERRG